MQVEELVQEDSRVDRYPKLVKGESKVVWEWQGKKVYPMPFDNNKQGVGSPKCCLLIINMVLLLKMTSYLYLSKKKINMVLLLGQSLTWLYFVLQLNSHNIKNLRLTN